MVRTRCVPHLPNHSDTSGRVASDLGSYSCQSATRVFGSSANSLNGSGSASCPPLRNRFVRMRRIASIQKAPHRRVMESVGRTQAKTQGPITMRRKRILFATAAPHCTNDETPTQLQRVKNHSYLYVCETRGDTTARMKRNLQIRDTHGELRWWRRT